MKFIIYLSKEELLKANSNLAKVSVQVQGKTGTYQSHRWINPRKAKDVLNMQYKRKGVNPSKKRIMYKDDYGDIYHIDEVIEEYMNEKPEGTLQQYIKENYTTHIVPKSTTVKGMTKDEIAKEINARVKNISREIQVDSPIDFNIGQIITLDKAESWTNGGEFDVENYGKYSYVFHIEDSIDVHAVDYYNEAETDILDAEDCQREKEVLIAAGRKFEVVEFTGNDSFDMEDDQGFAEVYLREIK